MGVGTTRSGERAAAALGLITQATIVFERADDVPNGGVLCALGALLKFGLLRVTGKHFEDFKGFYPIQSIFLSLAFLALMRIPSLEQLRYQPCGEWGKLLGLDRLPEVKTMREKIGVLCQDPSKVASWSGELARDWMNQDVEAAGVLYIDGHVRVYHGQATKLPRRYVSREKLCLSGTTDYWVNAFQGDPFFCVTKAVDPGLIEVLEKEIVPRLLEDVPGQPTQEQLDNDLWLERFTTVCDRECYSPGLFLRLWQMRIAILTYHKHPGADWPEEEFAKYTITHPNGETSEVLLAERGVMLSNGLWVREVRKLNEGGHQTSILSTNFRRDLRGLAVSMFARWNQENFFKYMKAHYGLDRLVEHATSPIPDSTKVINPDWRKLDSEVRSITNYLSRVKARFNSFSYDLAEKSTELFECWVAKKSEALAVVQSVEKDLEEARAKRNAIGKHIEIKDLSEEQRFAQLSPVRKQLSDTIKLMAYRAESALVALARQTLKRHDDGRSFVRSLLASAVNLRPDPARNQMVVEIHGQANPIHDEALAAMCGELNQLETTYPGTGLCLVFRPVRSSIFPAGQDV